MGTIPQQAILPLSLRYARNEGPERAEPEVSHPNDDSASPKACESSAFREFDDWVIQHLKAVSHPESESGTKRGEWLAARRSQVLAELIQTDPERSLRLAVPLRIRRLLPLSITSRLEERVRGNARLDVIATASAGQDVPAAVPIQRFASLNGKTYRAFVYGPWLQLPTVMNLPIRGIAVRDVLAVHADSVRASEDGDAPDSAWPAATLDDLLPASGAAVGSDVTVAVDQQGVNSAIRRGIADPSWTRGAKRVLFMRVNFLDDSQESIVKADAYRLMGQVNAFFQETSYRAMSLQTTVTPVLTLARVKAWYGEGTRYFTLLSDARQAAKTAGFDTDVYDLDCVHCQPIPTDMTVSRAWIGVKGAWLVDADVGTWCHEFGHNLGLHHANAWATTDGTSLGQGDNLEYGNLFDTMGYGNAHGFGYSAFERHLLQWLPELAVQSITSNGFYRLSAVDAPTLAEGRVYALKIRNSWDIRAGYRY